MSSELWPQVKEALAEAKSLDGEQRQEFLDTLQKNSPEVATEVRTLLKASETAELEGFLELPAAELGEAGEETVQLTRQSEPDEHDTIPSALDSEATVAVPPAAEGSIQTSLVAGDYQIEKRIGKGGMGEVHRAYQRSLRRHVALKLIPERLLPTPDQVARFQIEAEAAASFDHPGIVPVYEVGEHYGMHYYSMALVEGGSFDDYVGRDKTGKDKPRLPMREAAELIEQVCHAVQYAHDRAVIHRDIKPANILLDKQKKPRLTDFGLAKVLKEQDDLTMTGQVMGTPSYMAPEQASGRQQDISNRTDVYALGATLFALIAGRAPFGAANAYETIKEVEKKQAPLLSEFVPDVPADLQTICEKCLAKRPMDRYESADDLADDLRRYLDGFPIAARPQGWLMRGYLWSRRNPGIAASLATIAATLVVAAVVSTWFAIQTSQALAEEKQIASELHTTMRVIFEEASQNDLLQESGMQTIREEMLTWAQNQSKVLVDTGQSTGKDLADALTLLGRVQAELGKTEEAAKSFDRAIEQYEKLLDENVKDLELLAGLGQVHNEYSILAQRQLFERGEAKLFTQEGLSEAGREMLDSWRTHAFQCADWRERAAHLAPKDRDLQRLLANAKMNLSFALVEEARMDGDKKDLERARSLNDEARELRNELLAADPNDEKVLIDVAKGHMAEADLNTAQAESEEIVDPDHQLWKDILRLQSKAIATLEQLSQRRDDPELDWLLVNAYHKRADKYFLARNYELAIPDYENSERTLILLKWRNPRVTKYQKKLAGMQYNLSQAFLGTGNPKCYTKFRDSQDSLFEAIAINPQDEAALHLFVDNSKYMALDLVQSSDNQLVIDKAFSILKYAIAALQNLTELEKDSVEIDAAISELQQAVQEVSKKLKDQEA